MPLAMNRWKHFIAMALIGDGVMAVVRPRRDANAWASGPTPWRMLMRGLNERPTLTRVIGAAQIIGGVYWTISREQPANTEG
jgi:drug/metabolite transporter (DMT)-like permease